MGAVYEAIDKRLGITVALKETLSAEESMRKQFEREARLLAGMQHPALPRVSDHFLDGDRAFLVMQFIGGVDLAKIIARQPGPFPRDQVIAWADQLLDALIYLHSRDRQVIHRDIKPHNLKLTTGGQIALLDFGLAKANPNDTSVTASHAFYGYTRHYAPLEQIQDQRTDPRSDIYALGATLYHLLTGVKPPDAMVRASAVVNGGEDPLKPANAIHTAVGSKIATILNKALALKPEERYENANEFREALRRIGRTSAVVHRQAIRNETTVLERRERHESPSYFEPRMNCVLQPDPTTEPGVHMTLVGSARRFGPAGATAVLALIFAFAAGILYGSQRFFPEVEQMSEDGVTNSAAALRQSATTHKGERSQNSESSVAPAVKPKMNSEIGSEKTFEKTNAVHSEKKATNLKANNSGQKTNELRPAAPRRKLEKVGAPSIRFPKTDFDHGMPVGSPESRVRATKVSSSASVKAPQFFRAADGTQIVRFSDGSKRYVFLGRRFGPLAKTYQ
jgi:serine/threonine protein kinase